MGDSLAHCQALAHVTHTITFGTSIMPIYFRQEVDFASTAAFIHEISGGRFKFGIGVSHAPALKSRGIAAGKPLSDMRQFVERLHEAPRVGELPPLVLATLRRKMIRLAEEIGQGMVFANGARSHMEASLSVLSDETKASQDFFVGNMIPTCVNEDRAAAMAVNRKTLTPYAMLPNYRNYWKEAGFVEEMDGVEAALERGIVTVSNTFSPTGGFQIPHCLAAQQKSAMASKHGLTQALRLRLSFLPLPTEDRWSLSRRFSAFFNAGERVRTITVG